MAPTYTWTTWKEKQAHERMISDSGSSDLCFSYERTGSGGLGCVKKLSPPAETDLGRGGRRQNSDAKNGKGGRGVAAEGGGRGKGKRTREPQEYGARERISRRCRRIQFFDLHSPIFVFILRSSSSIFILQDFNTSDTPLMSREAWQMSRKLWGGDGERNFGSELKGEGLLGFFFTFLGFFKSKKNDWTPKKWNGPTCPNRTMQPTQSATRNLPKPTGLSDGNGFTK